MLNYIINNSKLDRLRKYNVKDIYSVNQLLIIIGFILEVNLDTSNTFDLCCWFLSFIFDSKWKY